MYEDRICKNQPWGQHIVVRCSGCGSRHSTKNIGSRNEVTNKVNLSRHLFDIYDEVCKCKDPAEFPIVHDCKIDDVKLD
jgi:transcription elongation factor Elf1